MDMAQCGLSCSLFLVLHSLLSASTASSASLKHTEHVPTFRCSYWLVSPFCLDSSPSNALRAQSFASVSALLKCHPKNFPDYTLDPGQPYDPSFLLFITAVVSQTCLLPACCPHETTS